VKQLHKPNFWSWSVFNPERNLDFQSVLWCSGQSPTESGRSAQGRPATAAALGTVVIDPLPLSEHDRAHLQALGGAQHIIVTNSDHERAAVALAAATGARVWGPRAEPECLAKLGARALEPGMPLGPGIEVLELEGSKSPGELALILEGDTLVSGDLIRGQRAGRLNLLPDDKLRNKAQALESLRRLRERSRLDAVLVGDGWSVFRGGSAALDELLALEA
jgi:glyoxylase-like metal-dependent hydrolase (beta-lactamase superfamily II)